jgi:preprotein translocase subunit SecY
VQLFETIRNGWKLADLRKKIFFTVFIILLFRLGSFIPAPFIDAAALSKDMANATAGGTLFSYLSILTGGALNYGAIFAMGVTPYINSSIIMQLLSVAIPALEQLAKEGEEGRKKMAKLTRFATVILALIQGTAYYFYMRNQGTGYLTYGPGTNVFAQIFTAVIIVLCFTAGSALIMWMGEQIDEKGIGNGISMILFAGIISRGPVAFVTLYNNAVAGKWPWVIAICVIFLLIIAFIVFMTAAERRIPVQYAKKVVGRKMYGGQNTHLPIQVNMAGVMPIIFASSILSIPSTILAFMGNAEPNWFTKILNLFSYEQPLYVVLYLLLIVFFAYFYVTIQYNPVEMANNLRKNSGVIPGLRPGRPTSDFIGKVISKITLVGAMFLGVMAVLPIIVGSVGGMNVALGGTSILILVGVALDTVKSIESQMMMRYYKGFLD